MKKLSSVTISGGLTVDQATTLSGVVSVGGIGTGAYTSVLVRNSSNQMLYRNYSDFLNDISGSLNLSGYVPTSRTLTINGTTYDLSANRTWTITTPFVSKLQHTVKAGVAINKGQAVYVTGADGTNMIVGLASNASEATSSKTMGLLDATVSTNGFANVVTEGLLAGLDTSTAGTEGDPVWLGTGGNLIYGLGSKPYAPAHLVFIGIVTRKNNSNGEIFVKVQNGFELKEIHDVDLITTAPINGHLLGYNGTLWVNKTIATWLGYTPANASGTTNYISKFTGSTTLGNSQIFDNGTNVGIGTATPSVELAIYQSSTPRLHLQNSTSGTTSTDGLQIALSGVDGYLWNWENGPLIVGTNNAERMRITSAGNVGIGTTAPSHNLHIYGTGDRLIKIENTGTYLMYAGLISNEGYIGSTNATPLGFYTNNVNRLYINTSGNVGIGTSSPTNKLYVSATVEDYVAVIENLGTGTAKNGLWIKTDSSFTSATVLKVTGGTSDFETLQVNPSQVRIGPGSIGQFDGTLFLTSSAATVANFVANNSSALFISGSGNVGIGTTAPFSKLTVSGALTSSASQISIVNTEGGHAIIRSGIAGVSNNGMSFITASVDGTSQVNNMVIDAAGKVGIGTTAPATKLDVNGGINIANGNNLTWGGTYAAGIPTIVGYNAGTGGALYFYPNGSTSGEKMRLHASGNLSVGNTNDTFKLDVSGTIRATGNVTFNGTSFFGSDVFTYNNGGIFFSGGGTYTSGIFQNAGGLQLQSGGSPRLTIASTGAATFSANVNVNTYLSLGTGSGKFLAVGGAVTAGSSADLLMYNTGGDLILWTTGAVGMIVKGTSGNVGIGTTAPGAKLEVEAATAGYASIIRNTTAGGDYLKMIGDSGNTVFEFGSGGTGGDGFVNIYSDNSQKVLINADGTSYFNGGNVGIGTTAPYQSKLHILKSESGSSPTPVLRIGNQGAGYTSRIILTDETTNDANISYIGATQSLGFGLGASLTQMVLTSSGNVGIGTTSPSEKIHINTTTGTLASLDNGDGAIWSTLSNTKSIGLCSGTNYAGGSNFTWMKLTGGASGNIIFAVNNEAMRITSAGNVLIGTTTDSGFKLRVNGTSFFDAPLSCFTGAGYITAATNDGVGSSNGFGYSFLINNIGHEIARITGNYQDSASGGTGGMSFYTRLAGTLYQRLTIGGNGAATFSSSVTVNANSSANAIAINGRSADNTGSIDFFQNNGTTRLMEIGISPSAAEFYYDANSPMIFSTNATERMRITAAGNVGIGTTSPEAKLHIVSGSGQAGFLSRGTNGDTWFPYSNGQNYVRGVTNFDLGSAYFTGGNVGIGTTSPANKLVVTSDASPTSENSYAIAAASASDPAYKTIIGYDYSNDIGLIAAVRTGIGWRNLSIPQGSLGIGTYSPSVKLHVVGNAWINRPTNKVDNASCTELPSRVEFNNAFTAGSTGYTVFTYPTASVFRIYGDYDGNIGGLQPDLQLGLGYLTVKNSGGTMGNVGIGTTSPATKLDVNGVITATGGNSTNWNTAYGWGNHASYSYATTSYVTTQINNLINGAPGALDTLSELATALGNDASFATTVTNSIASKLPLTGGTLSGAIVVNLGNVSSDTVAFKVGGPANYDSLTIGMEDSPDYDAFIASYGNDIRFYSGKGLSSENHSFYWFTSKAGTSQHSVVAMQLDHNQNLTIGGFLTESSSLKLKENIKTSEGNLEKVVNLRPVTYNKIGSQIKELGLIAEEVAEVYPEFVQYDENGEPIGVNYSRLTAALIGAVKELTKRIETLENNG